MAESQGSTRCHGLELSDLTSPHDEGFASIVEVPLASSSMLVRLRRADGKVRRRRLIRSCVASAFFPPLLAYWCWLYLALLAQHIPRSALFYHLGLCCENS